MAQVRHGPLGRCDRLVRLRDPRQCLGDLGRGDLGRLAAGGPEEAVLPGAHGRTQLLLQRCQVDLVVADGIGIGVHGEVHLRQPRFGDPRGVVDRRAAQPALQHIGHRQARRRRVAVAGQVDQAGDEPAVRVAVPEHPHGPPPDHRQHTHGGVAQPFLRRAEQLLPRQTGDHFEHPLAGVGLQRETGAADRLLDPVLDHRDVEHALVEGRHRQHAGEAVLADHRALRVAFQHGDHVGVDGSQRARRAGPGDHEVVLVAARDHAGARGERRGRHVVAQDADDPRRSAPRPRCRHGGRGW